MDGQKPCDRYAHIAMVAGVLLSPESAPNRGQQGVWRLLGVAPRSFGLVWWVQPQPRGVVPDGIITMHVGDRYE